MVSRTVLSQGHGPADRAGSDRRAAHRTAGELRQPGRTRPTGTGRWRRKRLPRSSSQRWTAAASCPPRRWRSTSTSGPPAVAGHRRRHRHLRLRDRRARPGAAASVLEKPPVDRIARRAIERRGFAGRVDVIASDMLTDPLPADHDVHLFSNVLHDWDEDVVQQLLRASAAALPAGRNAHRPRRVSERRQDRSPADCGLLRAPHARHPGPLLLGRGDGILADRGGLRAAAPGPQRGRRARWWLYERINASRVPAFRRTASWSGLTAGHHLQQTRARHDVVVLGERPAVGVLQRDGHRDERFLPQIRQVVPDVEGNAVGRVGAAVSIPAGLAR